MKVSLPTKEEAFDKWFSDAIKSMEKIKERQQQPFDVWWNKWFQSDREFCMRMPIMAPKYKNIYSNIPISIGVEHLKFCQALQKVAFEAGMEYQKDKDIL